MVTWSLDTLLLALELIGILCAIYIIVKAFQLNTKLGAVFLVAPIAFFFASRWIGLLIAGVLLIASQIYFVRQPYVWRTFGRIYVYMMLCWAGTTYITARQTGWTWIPMMITGTPEIAQAGSAAVPANGSESLLPVDGGRIWYRKVGTGTGTPVILLHGGPGVASYYIRSLEALGKDRPVVRYDQLGAGRSDKISDTTRFTIERFVAELDSLRAALGYEQVHLVGHSWGTILGFEYYRAHPERVTSLTLASAALSGPAWVKHTRALLKTLPENTQQVIAEREASLDFDAPDYREAVDTFNARYLTLRPVEEDLDSTMKTMNQAIYGYMWGPSEFTLTGTLTTYDATPRLRRVKVPTLYTVGEFDEAGPETIRRFAKMTPGARVEVIPDAAHITTWDNPSEMLRVVREFLRTVDSVAAVPKP